MEKQADVKTVRSLYEQNLLSPQAFFAAINEIKPGYHWLLRAERVLLFLGVTLILSGCIFFFAYNWSKLGKFTKFGIIEAVIIVSVTLGFFSDLKRPLGQMAVISASVLTGVLLAVFGQTYQTGADAFGLFISWAVLIFGWVIAAQSAALWLIWLIIMHTGLVLFWIQVASPVYSMTYEVLFFTLAGLNFIMLVLSFSGLKEPAGFNTRWFKAPVLSSLLVCLSVTPITAVIDFNESSMQVTGSVLWLVSIFFGYMIFRFIFSEFLMTTLVVADLNFVFLFFMGKIILSDLGSHEPQAYFLFVLLILGVISSSLWWLKKISASITDKKRRLLNVQRG